MWVKLASLIGLVMALGLPLQAYAASTWTDCTAAGTVTTDYSIDKSSTRACHVFTTTEDSDAFHVVVPIAELCFDPNIATEGIDVSTINVRKCHRGYKPAANPEFECLLMNSAPLDGTTGSKLSQNACIDLERGTYFIENVVGAGGVTSVVSITAE